MPSGREGSIIFAEILLVLGFAPDASQFSRLLSIYGGKPIEGRFLPTKGVILSVQDRDGSDSLYSIEFNSDSDRRRFLDEARRHLHLKAILELEGEGLPFYVLCKVEKYGGSAFYDPSLDFNDP